MQKRLLQLCKNKTLPILGLILLCSGNAWASCEFAGALTGIRWTSNVGNIAVQRDAPIGTVIYSQSLNSGYVGRPVLSCTTTLERQTFVMLKGSPVSGHFQCLFD